MGRLALRGKQYRCSLSRLSRAGGSLLAYPSSRASGGDVDAAGRVESKLAAGGQGMWHKIGPTLSTKKIVISLSRGSFKILNAKHGLCRALDKQILPSHIC
jgi:hypothetical protein